MFHSYVNVYQRVWPWSFFDGSVRSPEVLSWSLFSPWASAQVREFGSGRLGNWKNDEAIIDHVLERCRFAAFGESKKNYTLFAKNIDPEDNEHFYVWLVVWNIFYFSIYWEESSQLTNIFQRGWNHQPDVNLLEGIRFKRARHFERRQGRCLSQRQAA